MCGIFAYITKKDKSKSLESLKSKINLTKHRGPDNTQFKTFSNNCFDIVLGFHRLAINDTSNHGNQPLETEDTILICNGEIYNHKQLETEYNYTDKLQGHSDCEVIIHMYEDWGIEETLYHLDGVYSFVLIDKKRSEVHVARDKYGVRPMFYTHDTNTKEFLFSSEMKSIEGLISSKVEPFNPMTRGKIDLETDLETKMFATLDYKYFDKTENSIKCLLEKAVEKRLFNSDRPVGSLLSGGLDSSLVAAIAQKYSLEKRGVPIHTFSIGMQDSNSPDLDFAKLVSNKIESIHHQVLFTFQEGLSALENVIYSLETYDVTTIRASTPMYLLSKWINQNTDIKVILSGEGADELFGGYLYFHDAPSSLEFRDECKRLLSELYKYDVLRSDRSTSAHGLEIRVPFLDLGLTSYVLENVDNYKPNGMDSVEKYLLRKEFEGLIPDECLWRQKDAFSDAVGYSWVTKLKEYSEKMVKDVDLKNACRKYKNDPPKTKEAYLYRQIYEKYFNSKNCINVEYQWMPKWQDKDLNDPSATRLNHHCSNTDD